MSNSDEELLAVIERNTTVTGSVIEFLAKHREALADESVPAEDRLSQAIKQLDENTNKLVAAIAANTVAASEVGADPTPVDTAPAETVTTEATSQVQ